MTQPLIQTLRAPNPGPFTGPGTNTYILGSDWPVVVDPGPDLPDHLQAILAALGGRRPEAVLVTHAHLDHSALAPRLAALTGAPVVAFGGALSGISSAMRQLMSEGLTGGEGSDTSFTPDICVVDGQTLTFGGIGTRGLGTGGIGSDRSGGDNSARDRIGSAGFGIKRFGLNGLEGRSDETGRIEARASLGGAPDGSTLEGVGFTIDGFNGGAPEGGAPEVRAFETGAFQGGALPGCALQGGALPDGALQGGGFDVQVIHTPGHMGGHICLALGDTLLSGDHVMGWSTSIVSPPEGDMTAYMAGLHKLAARRWLRFLPGHGDPIEDPAARLADLITHRLEREAAVLSTLGEGPATAHHLAGRIYTGLAPALLPAATRNVLAHLLDLQARGQVARHAGDPPGPLALARFARL